MISKLNLGAKKYRYYHIIAGLDSENPDASLAVLAEQLATNRVVRPTIPKTARPDEDHTIPRISVSTSIQGCITGIGLLGMFRRCLSDNEDAMSYAVDGLEVYPVIVLTFEFDKPLYRPTVDQVPDVDLTDEHWILDDAEYVDFKIEWLDMFSIKVAEKTSVQCRPEYVCAGVNFISPSGDSNHPWLNGLGHPLDSSDEEYIPGDIPWVSTNQVVKYLQGCSFENASSGCSKIVCENYHTVVKFILVSGTDRPTREDLLVFSVVDYKIKLVTCSDFIGCAVLADCANLLCAKGFSLDESLLYDYN